MKKLKILFSMICAIAIISSLCVPAFAYSDGDREVLYYNFNIGIPGHGTSPKWFSIT